MSQRWIDYSLQSFTDHLSAREPVPGGGGAAALIGALAAALCSMAGNYSTDKKSAEGHETELREAIDKAEELRMRLLALVDADAEAFAPLAAALECAGMNLLVNTRLLDDGMVMEHQLFQLLDSAVPRAKSITRNVMDELRR